MSAPRSPLPQLEEALQLVEEAVLTGNTHLLRRARECLVAMIGMAKPAHPASISGVPHLYWPPRGFTWTETASSYAGWNDRFIVSLIVGYGPDEAATAEDACALARDLVVGDGSDGTRWFVHDRAKGTDLVVHQGELPHVPDGAPNGSPAAA
ncbi:hypothetical protein VSS74_01590 [Conexibacter stalactiti]|uniref:Uncharacterized protein n=1 Tax=Conexibacter stalactiti TaxID=1940611 RepID=A0ABU4HI79_9ACTN|nr:hypothetical protein [Conexibacter stalactiti]MDW5593011.1 hypothetical protein [Conexibacter stalactiti]MEC5033652.1 hypothetical protein [Conexibacter stalactiti]